MAWKLVVVVGAFAVGAVAGVALWWLVWSPALLWFSGEPEPWTTEGGTLVVNDLFGALGKVAGVFVLPVAGGIALSKAAVSWSDRRSGRMG